jgi:hypothetical protein
LEAPTGWHTLGDIVVPATWLAAFGAIAVSCLVAGLSWGRFRWPAFVATGLTIAGYVTLTIWATAWYQSCPDCPIGSEDGRHLAIVMFIWLGWVPFALLIAATWLGVAIAVASQWLRQRPTSGVSRVA